MTPLVKHTIIIWTEPYKGRCAIADLAQDATDGDSYCSHHFKEIVKNPSADPHWDGTEFFGENKEAV